MKNNKGFTLMEIIVVITLLVLLSLIAIPMVRNSVENSKNKAYDIVVERIIDGTKSYFYENYSNYKSEIESNGYIDITVMELRISNALEKDLINPKTEKVIDGFVRIKVQGTYEYVYEFHLQ